MEKWTVFSFNSETHKTYVGGQPEVFGEVEDA